MKRMPEIPREREREREGEKKMSKFDRNSGTLARQQNIKALCRRVVNAVLSMGNLGNNVSRAEAILQGERPKKFPITAEIIFSNHDGREESSDHRRNEFRSFVHVGFSISRFSVPFAPLNFERFAVTQIDDPGFGNSGRR